MLIKKLLGLTVFLSTFARGQSFDYSKEILKADSMLFQVGFNTCDLQPFEQLLSSDFEFYHDKSGFSNRTQFLADLKTGLCSNPTSYQSFRTLNPKKNEFYPLYQNDTLYAVIQKGEHAFHEQINHQRLVYASTALFEHLWVLENGTWKLKRAYSYDHQVKRRSKKKK